MPAVLLCLCFVPEVQSITNNIIREVCLLANKREGEVLFCTFKLKMVSSKLVNIFQLVHVKLELYIHDCSNNITKVQHNMGDTCNHNDIVL